VIAFESADKSLACGAKRNSVGHVSKVAKFRRPDQLNLMIGQHHNSERNPYGFIRSPTDRQAELSRPPRNRNKGAGLGPCILVVAIRGPQTVPAY
jgi:hypothetical protein